MSNIIEARDVSMRFIMERDRTDTIKEYILKMVQRNLKFSEFYALKGVSFGIQKGESVALIGANGSGKSTMLKIIAGVMRPTRGSVSVEGTIAPLIELGAGFDGDLTARENVFLNGALLGHDRREMEHNFQQIVEFSELGNFIDVPVRSYSSGMVARLGFAIATQVEADILVVDEILSVGDYSFQQKCHRRMEEMLAQGSTLLFVSHDAEQVKRLCKRAIWLDHGNIVQDGPSGPVCDAYLASQANR